MYLYKHLLILGPLDSENGTILLATKDKEYAANYGRFKVLPMEMAESGDYFKIYTSEGIRALHGYVQNLMVLMEIKTGQRFFCVTLL